MNNKRIDPTILLFLKPRGEVTVTHTILKKIEEDGDGRLHLTEYPYKLYDDSETRRRVTELQPPPIGYQSKLLDLNNLTQEEQELLERHQRTCIKY